MQTAVSMALEPGPPGTHEPTVERTFGRDDNLMLVATDPSADDWECMHECAGVKDEWRPRRRLREWRPGWMVCEMGVVVGTRMGRVRVMLRMTVVVMVVVSAV